MWTKWKVVYTAWAQRDQLIVRHWLLSEMDGIYISRYSFEEVLVNFCIFILILMYFAIWKVNLSKRERAFLNLSIWCMKYWIYFYMPWSNTVELWISPCKMGKVVHRCILISMICSRWWTNRSHPCFIQPIQKKAFNSVTSHGIDLSCRHC